jgi:hypothetical protein
LVDPLADPVLSRAELIDLMGSTVSVLTLFGCTAFVLHEALRHLHCIVLEQSAEALSDTKSLFPRYIAVPNGWVLFAFSTIDTVAIILLLAVKPVRVSAGGTTVCRQYWRR